MSGDPCFSLKIDSDVDILDYRNDITDYIRSIYTDKKRFPNDALDDNDLIIYFGYLWKNNDRKSVCINVKAKNAEKLKRMNSQLYNEDLEVNDFITLSLPEKIQTCEIRPFKERKGSDNWKRLEYNGPYFKHLVDPYIPLGVNFEYDNKEYALAPDEEEILYLFARQILAELEGKPKKIDETFAKNFWNDFKDYLKENHKDHSKIFKDFKKAYFDNLVIAIRNKRDNTEKKKPDLVLRNEIKINYSMAYVDGKYIPVTKPAVEPMTLFIGRGKNIRRGKIKFHVYPEEVEINVSNENNPIPPRGHHWAKVVHDPKAEWVARWRDPISKEWKYSFIQSGGDLIKFENARKLNMFHDDVVKIYMSLLSKSVKSKQIGTAIYLIDNFGIRPGGEKESTKDEGEEVVGATTLEVSNLDFLNDGISINMNFLGKDSIPYRKTVKVDSVIYKALTSFVNGKNNNDKVFDMISVKDINDFLHSIDRGFSAKTFRTRLASKIMNETLNECKINEDDDNSEVENLACFIYANRAVAKTLNHVKSVDPVKTAEKMSKELSKIASLEIDLTKKSSTAKLSQLVKLQKNVDNYILDEDGSINFAVALDTSKKNYIDPRVIKVWTDKSGVDINNVEIYKGKAYEKHLVLSENIDSDWDYETSPLSCVESELDPKVDTRSRSPSQIKNKPVKEIPKKIKTPKPSVTPIKNNNVNPIISTSKKIKIPKPVSMSKKLNINIVPIDKLQIDAIIYDNESFGEIQSRYNVLPKIINIPFFLQDKMLFINSSKISGAILDQLLS
jgi:DNA topoisomerase-1